MRHTEDELVMKLPANLDQVDPPGNVGMRAANHLMRRQLKLEKDLQPTDRTVGRIKSKQTMKLRSPYMKLNTPIRITGEDGKTIDPEKAL